MFYESSPANGGSNAAPSSPLRQMSNSQSTNNGAAPSSPLRQQTETQSVNDGDRTPRASGFAIGGMSSPIHTQSRCPKLATDRKHRVVARPL